jgi:SAM-dependent MidA family methyltransferase
MGADGQAMALAVGSHRAHNDASILPGLQDITAWVHCDALADAGRVYGFSIARFASQANF